MDLNPEAIKPQVEYVVEFLTAKDLEAMLQIDRKTIYGYVSAGTIPYIKIQSNVRFKRDEIKDWIERQSYRPRQKDAKGAKAR